MNKIKAFRTFLSENCYT